MWSTKSITRTAKQSAAIVTSPKSLVGPSCKSRILICVVVIICYCSHKLIDQLHYSKAVACLSSQQLITLSSTKSICFEPLLLTVKCFEVVKQFQKQIVKAMVIDCYRKIANYRTMREICISSCTATSSAERLRRLKKPCMLGQNLCHSSRN